MLKKYLIGLGCWMLVSWAHADFSGTYQCDAIHKGQPSKGEITITQKDSNLSMTMQWEGKNKLITSDLMSTDDPNKFLSSWKGKNSVGIALWEFKDNRLTITATSLRKDNTSKIEEIGNCSQK
jgi:hypothetical protein